MMASLQPEWALITYPPLLQRVVTVMVPLSG